MKISFNCECIIFFINIDRTLFLDTHWLQECVFLAFIALRSEKLRNTLCSYSAYLGQTDRSKQSKAKQAESLWSECHWSFVLLHPRQLDDQLGFFFDLIGKPHQLLCTKSPPCRVDRKQILLMLNSIKNFDVRVLESQYRVVCQLKAL